MQLVETGNTEAFMNHLMTLCPAETKRFQRHQIKRFKYRCEAYPLVKQANLYNKERIFHLTDKLAFVRLEKKDISGFFLICLIIAHIICYAFLRLLLIIIDDPCLNIYMYMYLRNFFKDPFFFSTLCGDQIWSEMMKSFKARSSLW